MSKLWLTRRPDGTYMLTSLKPRVARVRGTQYSDAYVQEGEPIGVLHLCSMGVQRIFGLHDEGLEPLKPQRVEVYGLVRE